MYKDLIHQIESVSFSLDTAENFLPTMNELCGICSLQLNWLQSRERRKVFPSTAEI